MSSGTESPEEEQPEPLDAFEEALERFHAEIETIEEGSPSTARRQMEAVDEFLKTIAGTDPDPVLTRQSIAIVNDNVGFMTLSDAEKQLQNHQRSSSEGAERPDIRELLKENLSAIEKLATDEVEGEVRYRFVFSGGDSMVTDSETLYSPTDFRRAYNGVYDTLPRFDGQIDEWEDFLSEIQDQYLVVKSDAVGPRAAALTKLRSKVESSEAYIDRADAVRKGNGTLIDVDSREEAADAGTVWVLYDEIKRICDDLEITPEAFRVELDSRDLRTGSSEQKRFEGKRATFWPLVRSEFEPKLIEVDREGSGGSETESIGGDGNGD